MPKVLNKRLHLIPPTAIEISRPSVFGNPFEIGKDGNRIEVVEKYRKLLAARPKFVEFVKKELAGKDLVCWCSPEPCHGDVLLEIANLGLPKAEVNLPLSSAPQGQEQNYPPPFANSFGPSPAKILILGGHWGETEENTGLPFSGESGKELFRILGEAMPELLPTLHSQISQNLRYKNTWLFERKKWFDEAGIALSFVFPFRPENGKLLSLCVGKSELPKDYSLSQIARGKYIKPEYLPHLLRLEEEIKYYKPNLIVAMGTIAVWATLQAMNISQIRGTIGAGVGPAAGYKVLPTYGAGDVLRTWAWRPILAADLTKANFESNFPEIRRPERFVLVNPTLEEIKIWTNETLASPPSMLSVDIETGRGMIKCIGFARSSTESMVIPFVDLEKENGVFWPTLFEELEAWKYVKILLESAIPKLGQNFIYDLQYITRYKIFPKNCTEDTMLLHHALYPEMQKGLGFLGSIYTNEASWKLMNRRKAALHKEEKKDE